MIRRGKITLTDFNNINSSIEVALLPGGWKTDYAKTEGMKVRALFGIFHISCSDVAGLLMTMEQRKSKLSSGISGYQQEQRKRFEPDFCVRYWSDDLGGRKSMDI